MQSCYHNLSEADALLLLNGLSSVGPILATRLLEFFDHDPRAIFLSSEMELRRIEGIGPKIISSIKSDANESWLMEEKSKLEKFSAGFLTRERLPSMLHEIYDCPIGLYAKGEIPSGPYIAIVGTRMPTNYGERMAKEIAYGLSMKGFCVVSGMARGIDACAHQGALDANGKTIAFLGNGLDIVYPPEHYGLYQDIASTGSVLSEFPFGRKADRRTFPMRNRLVSGISCGVLVIESASKGGSMITAQFAAEQGRLVFALPGRVDQANSLGCNQLIREGATLVRTVDDIIEETVHLHQTDFLFMDSNAQKAENKVVSANSEFSPEEQRVLEILKDGGIYSMEEISSLSNLPPRIVSSTLTLLEINMQVSKHLDGRYESN